MFSNALLLLTPRAKTTERLSGFFLLVQIGLHPLEMHPVLVAWKRRDAVSVMTPTAWRSVATTKTSSYTDYQRLAHDTGRSTIGIRRFASSRLFLTGVNEHGQ